MRPNVTDFLAGQAFSGPVQTDSSRSTQKVGVNVAIAAATSAYRLSSENVLLPRAARGKIFRRQAERGSPGSRMVELLIQMVKVALLSILSTQHLKAAALFSRQAERIENKHVGGFHALSSKEKKRITSDYRSFVIAAVVLCTSFLEAFANELWSDTHQNKGSDFLKSIDQRKIEMMDALWDRHAIPMTARYPILRKFELFLLVADRAAYDRDQPPYEGTLVQISHKRGRVDLVRFG